jgi:hypothetical protein
MQDVLGIPDPKLMREKLEKRLDYYEGQLILFKRVLDEKNLTLQKVRQNIQRASGLSPENVLPVLLETEREAFALNGTLELRKFRLELLKKALDESIQESKVRQASDPVIVQLNKIVESKESILKEAKRSIGLISQSDILTAEAALAEAKIRILLRQEEAARKQKETSSDKIGQQLSELTIEVAQDEFRKRLLEKRLAILLESRSAIDEYNRLKDYEIGSINRKIEEAEADVKNIKNSLDAIR